MNRNLSFTLAILFWGLLTSSTAQPIIGFQEIASGFTEPVDIASPGGTDPRLFIVEQPGNIKILNPGGQVNGTPFLSIVSIVNDNRNERGLLGMVFHPDYANNGYFYVNYIANDNDTRISRFSVDPNNPNVADPSSEFELLRVDQPFSNHNAGDLAFGPDGYLYIALGDGGSGGDPGDRAQSNTTFLGKVIRIDVDNGTPYSIPADNPFVGDPAWQDEVWAIGLRNPWRFSFDRLTGDIWYGDVGQDDFEEISRAPSGAAGLNFGWRCYEANDPYNTTGCQPFNAYMPPVFDYVNSSSVGESVTGGFVYRGTEYPGLVGYYIFGDYETGNVWVISTDSLAGFPSDYQPQNENRSFSTFGEDHEGELYAADHSRGRIYRVTDACQGLSANIIASATNDTLSTEPGHSYQWFLNGSIIQGANDYFYLPTMSGTYSVDVTYASGCELAVGPFNYAATGIEDLFGSPVIDVYPNPFESGINLVFIHPPSTEFALTLYDLEGKTVRRHSGSTSRSFRMERQNLPAGVYLLEIRMDKTYRGKVVITD